MSIEILILDFGNIGERRWLLFEAITIRCCMDNTVGLVKKRLLVIVGLWKWGFQIDGVYRGIQYRFI